jgi:hypothetical protein
MVIHGSFSHKGSIMLNGLLGFTPPLAVMLVLGAAPAAEPKSGPQVGAEVHGFHPLNCTGDHAGEKHCLICQNGDNPVAIVFARRVTPEVNALIKRIDQATEKNKGRKMGSFAVFLSDADGLEKELKGLAKNENLRHCILTIDHPEGPAEYDIAPDAEVTVVLYMKMTVQANFAFKKDELDDKASDAIIADLARMFP